MEGNQDGDFVILNTGMSEIKGRILEIHDYRVKMFLINLRRN